MTEPKQSFTEEVQKEAEERYRPFFNQSSYDENALRRSTFIEGANVALSILSRKSEGREYWVVDSGDWNLNAYTSERKLIQTEDVYHERVHVIEHSALVAERAKKEIAILSVNKATQNIRDLERECLKLEVQLKLALKQRDDASKSVTCSETTREKWIAECDLELQKKGQGDE